MLSLCSCVEGGVLRTWCWLTVHFPIDEDEFVLAHQLIADLSQLSFEDLGIRAHTMQAKETHDWY